MYSPFDFHFIYSFFSGETIELSVVKCHITKKMKIGCFQNIRAVLPDLTCLLKILCLLPITYKIKFNLYSLEFKDSIRPKHLFSMTFL